jgi:hypothetical protein
MHLSTDDAVRKAILSQPDDMALSAFVELAACLDRMMISG